MVFVSVNVLDFIEASKTHHVKSPRSSIIYSIVSHHTVALSAAQSAHSSLNYSPRVMMLTVSTTQASSHCTHCVACIVNELRVAPEKLPDQYAVGSRLAQLSGPAA
jgi:hypothetical protein